MRPRFPDTFYNVISMFGLGAAMFALAAILILYVIDSYGGNSNPYLGIFILFLLPGVLVFGLLLIPLGMWRERRRRAAGTSSPLVVDFGKSQHRNAAMVFTVGTCLFLLLTTMGMYEGYHFMESNQFCGYVCHTAMEPEATTHPLGPHAEVHCVSCHIHPGPDWYLKAKLNGARQMWEYMRDTYHRPIPTPIEILPPTDVVCERCHWPGMDFDYPAEQFDYFLGDRDNTHWQIRMVKKVGGPEEEAARPTGSHWHIGHEVTYIASDPDRQVMEQVRWEDGSEPKVYTRKGEPFDGGEHAEERTMQCLDCHNRPAHQYPTPMAIMNRALASGAVDSGVPWVKRAGVEALSKPYDSLEEARTGITEDISGFYRNAGLETPAGVSDTLYARYATYNFPRMKTHWNSYPDNSGHFSFPGCFRCHGSDLETEKGETISADCQLCHVIVDQGPGQDNRNLTAIQGLTFQHPVDVGNPEFILKCTECHIGDGSVYLEDSTNRKQR